MEAPPKRKIQFFSIMPNNDRVTKKLEIQKQQEEEERIRKEEEIKYKLMEDRAMEEMVKQKQQDEDKNKKIQEQQNKEQDKKLRLTIINKSVRKKIRNFLKKFFSLRNFFNKNIKKKILKKKY
jgi:hypothetical protein